MSGITAAQYVRRKLGLLVFHVVEGTQPFCVVRQNDTILSKQPDDNWASLCVCTLSELSRTVESTFGALRRYPVPPASLFYAKFDVRSLVAAFDFEEFEQETLPALKGKTQFDAVVKEWYIIKEKGMMDGDIADSLEVYDWIVRLRVLQRQQRGGSKKILLPDVIRTDMEQLGTIKDAEFVKISNKALLPAFQAVHPNGKTEGDVFICNPDQHAVNEFGFRPILLPAFSTEVNPMTPVRGDDVGLGIPDADNSLESKVVRLLMMPRQKMSQDMVDFLTHGGHPEFVDEEKGGLGKNSLRGLKTHVGEGRLKPAIEKLAGHFAAKIPTADRTALLDLAAGRIAAMQGDYRAVKREDGWHIENKNRATALRK